MDFLNLLKSAVALLPILIDAIKAVEAAVPQTGQGPAKLDAVKAILQSAYALAGAVMPAFDKLWPMLAGMASALVALFNKAGVFVKQG